MSSRSRKIARGLSRGPIVFTDSGPVMLSGDAPLSLGLSTDGGKASITLNDPAGTSVLVAEGTMPEISRLYHEVCRDLAKPLLVGRISAFSAGALAGAVAMAAVWLLQPFPVPANPPADPLPATQQAPLLPGLEELRRAAEKAAAEADAGQEEGEVAGQEGAHVTPILDMPDFLVIPGEEADASGITEVPGAGIGSGEEQSGTPFPFAAEGGLPAYVPPASDDAIPEKSAEGDDGTTVSEEEVSSPAENAEGDEETGNADKAAEAGDEKVSEGQPGEGSPVEAITPEEAREEARKAAQSLVEKGMTPEKAQDVLSQLEALSEAEEITPDMLAGLPHEVAQMLVETGLVNMDDAPDGVPYRIIRIPESVIDKYRGPDGIPSIPERNTWASTGNFVSIPLPGGGDIRTPEDLKDFHLQP